MTRPLHCRSAKTLKDFLIREPEPEELKLLVRHVRNEYDPCVIPLSFQTPGKVADMVQ